MILSESDGFTQKQITTPKSAFKLVASISKKAILSTILVWVRSERKQLHKKLMAASSTDSSLKKKPVQRIDLESVLLDVERDDISIEEALKSIGL